MKKIYSFLLFALIAITGIAQDEPEIKAGFDKSRLFIGGNFGANFGDFTLINLSPQLGYRFSNFLAAGAGVNFIYSSIKYRNYNNDVESKAAYGVTGLNLFGRVYPIREILFQVQPELNYTWGKYKYYDGRPDDKLSSTFVPSFLVGAGAALPTGRGAFMAMLQYDVLQKDRSPYGTKPFLSLGYTMGF